MLKNTKKEIVGFMLMFGTLTSVANAGVPNAPGPYIGATLINDTSVRINFLDNSTNETGFIVTGDCLSSPILLNENNNSANTEVYVDVMDMPCNQTCSFVAKAYNEDGNSTNSDVRYINMHGTFGVECNISIPPAPPGPYIGVTDINDTAVRVNFVDNADNEDGFLLFDRTGDINLTVPTNSANNPSQTYVNVDGLTCNKTYFIKALAFNSEGNSSTSDERAFNIHSTFGVTCPSDNSTPAVPGPYIGVTDINKTAVRINFIDNSDNETGFRVFGDDINETIPLNNTPAPSQVYHQIKNLTCDHLYRIKAVAFNNNGDSLPSDERVFNIHTSFAIPCP